MPRSGKSRSVRTVGVATTSGAGRWVPGSAGALSIDSETGDSSSRTTMSSSVTCSARQSSAANAHDCTRLQSRPRRRQTQHELVACVPTGGRCAPRPVPSPGPPQSRPAALRPHRRRKRLQRSRASARFGNRAPGRSSSEPAIAAARARPICDRSPRDGSPPSASQPSSISSTSPTKAADVRSSRRHRTTASRSDRPAAAMRIAGSPHKRHIRAPRPKPRWNLSPDRSESPLRSSSRRQLLEGASRPPRSDQHPSPHATKARPRSSPHSYRR